MKLTQVPLFSTALAALLFTACSSEPGKTTENVNNQMQEAQREIADADDTKEWLNERDEARRELQNLRDRLVDRRDRTQERLTDGVKDAKKRAELETYVAELNTNIARIDAQYPRLDNATTNDWNQLRDEVRSMRDTTTTWLDRQMEKVDAQTKADADKDGK